MLVNRAFQRLTGFGSAEVQDRSIWNFLLAPEEVMAVQNALSQVGLKSQRQEHESYVLTKRGERRRIRWSYGALTRSATGVDTIIATGCDITPQRDAEARALAAENARQRTQTQLKGILSIVNGDDTNAEQPNSPSPPADAGISESADAESATISNGSNVPDGEMQGERRRRPRRAFSYCQRIAPMSGDSLPSQSMFRVVQCHDISAGGFAFVSPEPPAQESYVVVLGSAPVLIYVKVSVAHVTPTTRDGRDAFLVGCKYTGRVDY